MTKAHFSAFYILTLISVSHYKCGVNIFGVKMRIFVSFLILGLPKKRQEM